MVPKHVFPVFAAVAVFGLALPAQTTPEPPEIPRFQLSAGVVGFDRAPELYWMDVEFDAEGLPVTSYQPLDVGVGRRGSTVGIPIPEGKAVRLYRKSVSEAGDPRYVSVVDIPERTTEDQIFMIFYQTEAGRRGVYYLDDSSVAHPANTVRILNLSEWNMAASIGSGVETVRPGTSVNLGPPPMDGTGRFHYQFGASLPGGPWESPPLRLRLRGENHRLLVLYTLMPHVENVEGSEQTVRTFRPIAFRIYDRVEFPPGNGTATTERQPSRTEK